jgi:hypothetical protein
MYNPQRVNAARVTRILVLSSLEKDQREFEDNIKIRDENQGVTIK